MPEEPLTLRGLKSYVDKAVEGLNVDQDAKVEVLFCKKGYRILSVGQFGLAPDVTISIGEKFWDFEESGHL